MTSLPLIQKPTDIVSLLTLEENFKFSEILAETNIEDIPQLEESEKAIQKLGKISKEERDYRIKLLQQRLYQLSVIQSFRVFEEDYKDYKAHFSINGRGISIKIISPHGDSWEKQTQTFTDLQASREFHLIVDENLVKNTALATNLQSLSEKEKRWQILGLLTEGERVLYKGRVGTYKGVQDCATPRAWVFFEDSQITEPVNPLELTPENSDNNNLTLNTSSNMNLCEDEKSISSNCLTSCSQARTIVDLTQIDGENFLRPILEWDNEGELSNLPFELQHLENTEASSLADNLKQNSTSSNMNSKNLPFCSHILEGRLSKQDAEKIITLINSHLRQLKTLPKIQKRSNDIIRHYLVLLDEGKGYEQLGFKNMTALLNSDFIQGSRSNLQKQWQAGRIERDSLGVEPGTIPEDHCRKLAVLKAYPEQVQKAYAEIPFPVRKRQATTLTELPLSTQEEATIISLLKTPQTTSEIASQIGVSRGTTLKKLTYLEARRKVFRFGAGAGKPCWWALSLDAAVPNMADKNFADQFLELVDLRELSAFELKLKLGKRIEDVLSVGRRLQKAGKVRSYLKGDMQYFKAV